METEKVVSSDDASDLHSSKGSRFEFQLEYRLS